MVVARFSGYVRSPRGRMPPYTDKVLTEAQVEDLFAYVKSLPPSPVAKDIPLLSRIIGEK